MKNTIVLPHSHQVINAEHLAAACSVDVPGYKWEPVISKFLGFKFKSGSRRVIDPNKTDYLIKLWFVGRVESALYISYTDPVKRDADFKYLMSFATAE